MTTATRKRPQRQKRIEHTPKPWMRLGSIVWDEHGGRMIANCATVLNQMGQDDANARLIEKSPELLEAAQWVVRLFGTDHPEGIEDLKQKVRELREVCRAARGE